MASKKQLPWKECNDFILECGSIHEPYRFCVNVLDRISDLIPYDQALFFMLDSNRKIARKRFVGFTDRWAQMYLNYYSKATESDFALTGEAVELVGQGYVRLINWHDYDGSRDDLLVNYIRPRRLNQTLSIVLFNPKGGPATVFTLDRLVNGKFSEFEVEIAKLLTAHLNNLYKNFFVRSAAQVRMWDGIAGVDDLTDREREVLDLLCQGIKPVYISRELHISVGTVNKHIAHIYRKFGVDSKQELLVKLLGK